MQNSLVQSVKGTLSLISTRDRYILSLVIIAQTFLSIFDLIGIGLIGLVVVLGTSSITETQSPRIESILDFFSLEEIDTPDLLLILSSLAAILLVSKSFISYAITRSAYRFLAKKQAKLSERLIKELLSRPLPFIQTNTTQDTAFALTTGANAAIISVLGSAIVLISEIPVIVVLVLGLAIVDLEVTVFTILFFGLSGFFIHKVLASKNKNLGKLVAEKEIQSISAIQESLNSYREIVVFGRQSFYVDKVAALRKSSSEAQGTLQIRNQATKYVYEIMIIVGGSLLLVLQLATQNLVSGITIISIFLAATSRLLPSLLRMQTAAISIIYASGLARPTIDLANKLSEKQNEIDPKFSNGLKHCDRLPANSQKKFIGDLILDKVSFNYPGEEKPAISGLSLNIKAGDSIAIVGPTGSGKSTVADLIIGVLQPTSGTIKISGEQPSVIISNHPGRIAYVPQSISITPGTIRENVALGISEDLIDDGKVWESLRKSQLSNYLRISRLGLDTVVGEQGFKLSGGQLQRLGLARALYSNPNVLVLDEATSALDPETEAAVTSALSSLEGEVTTVIIAHRISTIRNCDSIIYLENGKEVARGNFEELRVTSPKFRKQARLSGL